MTLASATEYLWDVPDTVLNGLYIPNFVPENSSFQLIVFLFFTLCRKYWGQGGYTSFPRGLTASELGAWIWTEVVCSRVRAFNSPALLSQFPRKDRFTKLMEFGLGLYWWTLIKSLAPSDQSPGSSHSTSLISLKPTSFFTTCTATAFTCLSVTGLDSFNDLFIRLLARMHRFSNSFSTLLPKLLI